LLICLLESPFYARCGGVGGKKAVCRGGGEAVCRGWRERWMVWPPPTDFTIFFHA